MAIAKYHKKTPYSLILPYLDRVAPLVVDRLCTEPALLDEICKLMAISPVDFLSINLSKTLPTLLIKCDLQGLDVIAKCLDRDRAGLIVKENVHLHLAPVFLLGSPIATNKSVKFILDILQEASTDKSQKFDLGNVLPGYTTALLTELVIMMGDENPDANANVGAFIAFLKQTDSHRFLGHSCCPESGGRHQDRIPTSKSRI